MTRPRVPSPLDLCLALLLVAGGCRPSHRPEPGGEALWTAKASVDMGRCRHKEQCRLQELKSEWGSAFVRPRLTVDLATRAGFQASGQLSGFWTNDEDETWELGGAYLSENRLEISGCEGRLLAGWGFWFEDVGTFSLLGGLALRTVNMERELPGGTRTELDSDLFLAEVEGRASLPLGEEFQGVPVSLEMSASWGWLLDPEAEVEGAGTIEGDRGWLLRLRAGFDFRLNQRTSLYLGGFWEVLDIEGGTKGAAEWPDSETKSGGGELGLRVRF